MTMGTDAGLPVMTVLEAHVPAERWAELLETSRSHGGRLPPQLLRTFLVQGEDDPTLWRIIAIWRSRAALDEYRAAAATPGGVAMFRAVGAEPSLGIWRVRQEVPDPHGAAPG